MKTKEQFEQAGFYLRPSEIQELEVLIVQLKDLQTNKKLSMDMLTALTNIHAEINALKDKISWRLIHLIKQGHQVD